MPSCQVGPRPPLNPGRAAPNRSAMIVEVLKTSMAADVAPRRSAAGHLDRLGLDDDAGLPLLFQLPAGGFRLVPRHPDQCGLEQGPLAVPVRGDAGEGAAQLVRR